MGDSPFNTDTNTTMRQGHRITVYVPTDAQLAAIDREARRRGLSRSQLLIEAALSLCGDLPPRMRGTLADRVANFIRLDLKLYPSDPPDDDDD